MARIVLSDGFMGFSGRIGDAVIYSWRGVTCMRRHVVPRNPDTLAQRERRQRFAAAVQCWKSLSDKAKARWNTFRPRRRATGYNIFVSEYMRCEEMPVVPSATICTFHIVSGSSLLRTPSASRDACPNGADLHREGPLEEPELALSG